MEKAMEYLRQKGIASADKKMGRIAMIIPGMKIKGAAQCVA